MFCARPRGVPLKSVSTPKRSACYASAVLFLLCQSRYLLFLLGVTFFLFLYKRYSRVRANFLKPFKIKNLAISSKSPGLKFCRFVSLLPDFLLWNVGPVTLHPHVCDTRVTYCALLRIARPRYPRPIAAAEHIADALAGGDQPVQVYTGSNTHWRVYGS